MLRCREFAVALGALSLVPLGSVAASVPAPPAPTVEERIAALPDTMLGISKSYRDGNKSVTMYFGTNGQPMIGVWLAGWPDAESWGGVRDGTRGMLADAKLFRVVRESDFESDRFPGLHGFYGEYQTADGWREIWIIFSNGALMKVNAAYFDAKDHDRVYREVEERLFGKLTLNDDVDPDRSLNTAVK